MPTPELTSQRWKHVDTQTSEDGDTADVHMTLMEINTGEVFVISISGRGEANSGYWSGALMAAVAYICKQTGQPLPNGTHFETANTVQ